MFNNIVYLFLKIWFNIHIGFVPWYECVLDWLEEDVAGMLTVFQMETGLVL